MFTRFAVCCVVCGVGCAKSEVPDKHAVETRRHDQGLPATESARSTTGQNAGSPRHSSSPNQKSESRNGISKTEPPSVRRYAGLTLSEWRERMKALDPRAPESVAAVGGLIEIMRDDRLPWFTRREAALTLGRIGPGARKAVGVLANLLETEAGASETTLNWAVKALALFGREAQSAAPALVRLLRDTSQPVARRLVPIGALAAIGTSHRLVVPTLIELLGDRRHESDTLRSAAAEAVGSIGPAAASALPALIRNTRDDREPVRRTAVVAIGAMGRQAEIAIQVLVESLAFDESDAVRDDASTALGRIGPPAEKSLIGLLGNRDPEIRWRAALSLGGIKPPAKTAAKPLTNALRDDNQLVRIHAVESLWKITADPERVIPTLLADLKNPDREIRMRAYKLLISLGPSARTAIGPLKQLLNDDRDYVRRAATQALRKIETGE